MNPNFELPSTKAIISTAASVAATAMLVRSVAKDFIPDELKNYFFNKFHQLLTTFSNEITLVIDEFDGLNRNQLFHAAELYVSTIMSPSTKSFRASLPEKEKKIRVSVGGYEEITDKFCGVVLKWRLVTEKTKPRYVPYQDEYFSSSMVTETRYLQLTFHKKLKSKVINEYLPYVLERSIAVGDEKKTLKLYTLKNDGMHGPRVVPWQCVNLDHPANFETLAMDDEIKKMIIDDLDMFVKRKEFYRKVGKAWKRGYLLFGPPGTGKSSLIAAMANYLNFDVYDLELTDIRCNSELRKLLISTANKSILVVEDIDASIDLSERSKEAAAKAPEMYPFGPKPGPKVTLSGLLNFIDGLWSSCGDERIIIFTTNHKEKLDPALLRPGRMDVHIHMSYCTPCGFKMLVSNYLDVTDHPLVFEAEELIASSKVTPAEIAEQLLKCNDPQLALQGLIQFLEHKRETASDEEETEKAIPSFKTSDSSDGIKELIKMAKASPAEILNKDEVFNALKVLMGFLQEEVGAANVKEVQSGKEDGIKSE